MTQRRSTRGSRVARGNGLAYSPMLGSNLVSEVSATGLIAAGDADGVLQGTSQHVEQVSVIRIVSRTGHGDVEGQVFGNAIAFLLHRAVNRLECTLDVCHFHGCASLGGKRGHLSLDPAAQFEDAQYATCGTTVIGTAQSECGRRTCVEHGRAASLAGFDESFGL